MLNILHTMIQMQDKLVHLFRIKHTLFLQGVLRVPHLQLSEHKTFFTRATSIGIFFRFRGT
jgi:hypothetical protein